MISESPHLTMIVTIAVQITTKSHHNVPCDQGNMAHHLDMVLEITILTHRCLSRVPRNAGLDIPAIFVTCMRARTALQLDLGDILHRPPNLDMNDPGIRILGGGRPHHTGVGTVTRMATDFGDVPRPLSGEIGGTIGDHHQGEHHQGNIMGVGGDHHRPTVVDRLQDGGQGAPERMKCMKAKL